MSPLLQCQHRGRSRLRPRTRCSRSAAAVRTQSALCQRSQRLAFPDTAMLPSSGTPRTESCLPYTPLLRRRICLHERLACGVAADLQRVPSYSTLRKRMARLVPHLHPLELVRLPCVHRYRADEAARYHASERESGEHTNLMCTPKPLCVLVYWRHRKMAKLRFVQNESSTIVDWIYNIQTRARRRRPTVGSHVETRVFKLLGTRQRTRS
ncbi:hypothetical protein B0H11DRAFT_2141623 [Mycena galericulata]|nr:hypothetical protein B0H11DRAFT_2141623 [Mycena galericulata]